jgi:diguanylate cyclase (GGDEF)-like protein/PAS domain S-box-containing protein
MKITRKIMLIMVVVLIVALSISNLMVYFFARNFVAAQEKIQMDELIDNVQGHVESRLDSYLGVVSDWGHWDEPYDYLKGDNPGFVEENINKSTFENLNIDFVVIIDQASQQVRDKVYYDNGSKEFIPFPYSHTVVIENIAFSGKDIDEKTFLVKFDKYYYYLAISAITDTDESASPTGYMIFGKEIDGEQLGLLGLETNTMIRLLSSDQLGSQVLSDLGRKQASGSPMYISLPDADKSIMSNYLLYQDSDRVMPPVILLIEKNRNFYYDSLSRFSLLTLAISAMVLFSSLLIYYLLIRYITNPLEKVTNEVANLPLSTQDLSGGLAKITNIGNDEIGELSKTINLMIEKNHKAQLELIHSEEQFRIMFEEAPLGIGLFDFHTGKVLRINRKFAEILHRSRDEFLTMDWQSITHPEDMAQNNINRERIKSGEINGFSMVKRYLTPDGGIIWINLTIVLLDPITDNHPRELCMIEDITARKQKEEEVIYLSFNDVLTGVYNRRFFEEEKKRLDTGRQLPLSILIADLDGLKLINDGFGYSSGDYMLKEAAALIKQTCRAEDIVARIGGDEFCVLLPQTDGDVAKTIVNRIHQAFRNTPLRLGNATIVPSISIGYATKTSSAMSMEEVIASAEDSMRKRKLLNRKSVRSDLINTIKATMLEKSHETAEHAERMATLSVAIGEAMGLSNDELFDLELAATLHDIGKMSIDHQILSKPGKLTEEEWLMIKQHPETGYRIANSTTELVSIAEYILCHHERWDGSGYPQGLKGDEIPLISRIVSLVDSFDAMTENRPYRSSFTMEQAKAEIINNAGSQFDPAIVSIFVEKVLRNHK